MTRKATVVRCMLAVVALVLSGSARAQSTSAAPRATARTPQATTGQTGPATVSGNRAKAHILGFLDAGLQQNPLTAAQRQAIGADIDQLVSQAHSQKAERQAALDKDLQLFTADRLDRAALQQSEQQQADQEVSRFVAFTAQVHDVLTPAQRQELAAYIEQHPFEHRQMG